jgi:polyhydroxybutyrate depolymerase
MSLRGSWCAFLIVTGLATPAFAVTITDYTITRPEGGRHYIVAEAEGKPRQKRPLVILLHGHGATAAMMLGLAAFGGYKTHEWSKLAERENVLILAPDGVKASDGKTAWNDCRGDASTNAATDDVGLIASLIDTAIAQLNADPERIYVFGGSNGGGMAYRVGIELGPRIAAIGVQSGLMPVQSACSAPSHPLSVFISHGTADKIAPYAGGKVGNWLVNGRGSGISAEESVAVWRKLAGLADTPAVYRFPHLHPDDPTSATRYVWGADPTRIQVEFLKIDGGGHTGAAKDGEFPWILRKLVGEMNHDVNTAEEVWAFFKYKRNASIH